MVYGIMAYVIHHDLPQRMCYKINMQIDNVEKLEIHQAIFDSES